MKVVRVDKQPFMAAIGFVEARYYDQESSPIKCTSKRKDGVLRKSYMDTRICGNPKRGGQTPKVTTIMPYRPTISPIIEEIDGD